MYTEASFAKDFTQPWLILPSMHNLNCSKELLVVSISDSVKSFFKYNLNGK